jgi:hypothetical protein
MQGSGFRIPPPISYLFGFLFLDARKPNRRNIHVCGVKPDAMTGMDFDQTLQPDKPFAPSTSRFSRLL